MTIVTHKTKGGLYIVLHIAKAAGKLKEACGGIVVYKSLETGKVFCREHEEFKVSMEHVE